MQSRKNFSTHISCYKIWCIIIAFGLAARVLFSFYQPTLRMTPDSFEYLQFAKNIITQPSVKLVINPYRAPVYPLVLTLLEKTTDETQFANAILLIQGIFGCISAIVVFETFLKLGVSRKWSGIGAGFMALDMLLIPWERLVLTESLSILWVATLAYSITRMIDRPKKSWILGLLFLSLVGIYLRPALLPLPIVTYIFLAIFFMNKHRQYSFLAIIALGAIMVTLFIHAQLNRALWNYPGFQMMSDIIIFGRILEFHPPIPPDTTNVVADWVKTWQHMQGANDPYLFFDQFDPAITVHTDRLRDLHALNARILHDHFFSFMFFSFKDIPRAVFDISSHIMIAPARTPLQSLLAAWQQTSRVIHIVGSFLLLLTLGACVKNIVKKTEMLHPSIVLFALLAISLTALSLLDYEDYARIVAPISPLLILTAGYWIDRIVSS